MRIRLLLLALAAGAAASLGLLWLTGWPLGVPGEWVWARIPTEGAGAEVFFGGLLGLIGAAVYLLFVGFGARRMTECGRSEAAAWLTGLVAAGFFWLWMVQDTPVEGRDLSKAPLVLYYPSTEGYFFFARYHTPEIPAFLAGYEDLMAQGDVLHIGTHPPGLLLRHRSLIAACTRSPGLRQLLRWMEPASVSASFDDLQQRLFPKQKFHEADRTALWLAALLTQLAAAAAVVPLYLLVRRTHPRPTGWMVAALWPLVPAVAVFLPKSDALYPLLGLLFLWTWLEGWRWRSALLCLCAGLLLWLGMLLSLALLPVALLAAVLTLWESGDVESSLGGRGHCCERVCLP